MSSAPFDRDPDLVRLLDDGYDVAIVANHLLVNHIPYLNDQGAIAYGRLTYPVSLAGDVITPTCQHEIWLVGSRPHAATGQPLALATPSPRHIAEGIEASFMLSSKPMPEGAYPDQYTKITSYVRILAHEAFAIDPTVTATPGAAWVEVDSDSPFVYRDTATSRAGIAHLVSRFHGHRVGIVGLGGTGSYILDQVAKTPVALIRLIDGDYFENHNAFRAPGAASLEQLRDRPKKVHYYKDAYSHMHRSIEANDVFIDPENLILLDDLDFVFLASDDSATKPAVIGRLEELGVPFIDVGMGVEEVDGHLTGLLRTTTSLPGHRDHVHVNDRIPIGAHGDDDYGRNIQVADLNALNALMAVLRWKRYLGFYADGTGEGFSTFSIYAGEIANEDCQ
jgi:hypothetical protein